MYQRNLRFARMIAFGLVVNTLSALGADVHAQRRTESAERSHHAAIQPMAGGPLVMALGDSLAIIVNAYDCHGDVCLRQETSARPRFVSQSPSLQVSANGVLRARTTGVFRIAAELNADRVQDSVLVLPPVKDLIWTVHPDSVFVGDTLHIGVMARDSAGKVVRLLGVVQHGGTVGNAGEVQWWDRGGLG